MRRYRGATLLSSGHPRPVMPKKRYEMPGAASTEGEGDMVNRHQYDYDTERRDR